MPELSSKVLFQENLRQALFEDGSFWAEFMLRMRPALYEIAQLATHEDIQTLREEIRLWREESNERFEKMDERFEALHEEMKRGFEVAHQETLDLRREMNERFAAAQKETLDLRREMNERFVAVHREMNERFAAAQKETLDLRREMNERFVAVHQEMNERFEKQGKDTHRLLSALGGRWGVDIEATFRNLTQELVEKRYGGVVQKWRRYLPEERREEEIDLVLHNGEAYAVEIKSSVSKRELYGFIHACHTYEALEGKKLSRRILASPYVPPKVKALAEQEGVEVFTGEEEA